MKDFRIYPEDNGKGSNWVLFTFQKDLSGYSGEWIGGDKSKARETSEETRGKVFLQVNSLFARSMAAHQNLSGSLKPGWCLCPIPKEPDLIGLGQDQGFGSFNVSSDDSNVQS